MTNQPKINPEDIKIVPKEQKRWIEIKEAAEREIGNNERSIKINERIIILADEEIENNKLEKVSK